MNLVTHLFLAVSFIQIKSYTDSKVYENYLSNQIPQGNYILVFLNNALVEILEINVHYSFFIIHKSDIIVTQTKSLNKIQNNIIRCLCFQFYVYIETLFLSITLH